MSSPEIRETKFDAIAIKEFTGKDLIQAGQKAGKWFPEAIRAANTKLASKGTYDDALSAALKFAPPPVLSLKPNGDHPLHINISAQNEAEQTNVANVVESMEMLLRTPVLKEGAIMPDACPAGPKGTIPVGGIASSTGIHPGMHSADICCSMAISVFDDQEPEKVLNAFHKITHFGPGGRDEFDAPQDILEQFEGNRLLAPHLHVANHHFCTQGDGNHFAYVGMLKSSGKTALVTHHGSRAPGARLFKTGMKIADKFRRELSPETLKQNAWIPGESREAEQYWEALQLVRAWTKANHFALHDACADLLGRAKVIDRFWNEHNFVFRKSDGLFYHGKGATPAFNKWADDATDLTIIPLNMAEPILIAKGKNAPNGMGFSPHGAGRNYSRTHHKRLQGDRADAEIMAAEVGHLDVRFFCGMPDVSELPSAYKNAKSVRSQIEHYGLADIVDEVLPYGSIMAGDWEDEAPWRKKRK